MRISQIYITDSEDEELSPYLLKAISTVVNLMPHSEHKIYRKQELREWIESEYGLSMLKSFDKLVPYAFKADLARYLLLYKYGGWYFDISIRVLNGVTVSDNTDMVTFLDLPHYSGVSYACSNGIIFSKPKSYILQTVINSVCSNIKNDYYGLNVLFPTGPVCFGRAVANSHDDYKIATGTFMDLTPGFKNKNRGFILNDGTILALHKSGNIPGDMKSLGSKGTNNYMLLYEQRKIYDQTINIAN